MQSEYLYFGVFVLVAAALFLGFWRLARAARVLIDQLKYEIRRDRQQHQRIEREKSFQSWALRRGTHKINGKPRNVSWDSSNRRARRDYHVDEAADEVFDPVSNVRGMDIRTPWGWPRPHGYRTLAAYSHPSSSRRIFGDALSRFFSKRQLVDDEFRIHRERSIRALIEDRYGRAGLDSRMPDVEWSRPALPEEFLEERAHDQMFAWKPEQGEEGEAAKLSTLRVVPDASEAQSEPKKASGE